MDLASFTLFFMVCLMGFHGNMCMPHECIAPAGKWPEECEDATFCFCKPEDYPSAEKIQEILKPSDVALSKIKPPTPLDNRLGENMCRYFVMKDAIYMIKDMADSIRYVIQAPSLFQYQIEIEECHKDQSLGALEDSLQCRQKTTPMKFLVLTADKTGVELADIKKGLPVSCALEPLSDD